MNISMLPLVDLSDWYWAIAGDKANVWSSRRAASVPVGDAEYVAWLEAGNHFTTPIPSMQELHAVLAVQHPPGSLETYNAFKRWEKEQGGITLSFGMPIKTDDRAQAKITGVYAAQQVNPAVTTPWHAADGSVRDLTAAEMEAMNIELLTHINNCFAISQDVLAGIAGSSITTRQQIDDAYGAPITQARKKWLKTAE
jgi:hypothetical protein